MGHSIPLDFECHGQQTVVDCEGLEHESHIAQLLPFSEVGLGLEQRVGLIERSRVLVSAHTHSRSGSRAGPLMTLPTSYP